MVTLNQVTSEASLLNRVILPAFQTSLFTLSLLVLGICYARAQDFPSGPIRMLVPFAPGGGVDTMARLVGAKMSELLGQTIVIDHRPGAGGNLGADAVAKATPDGSTILLTVSGLAASPSLYKALPFDPLKDLAPVSQLAASTLLLVVTPKLPVTTIQELIALAKAKPGSLNFGSSGVGAPLHLTMEIMKHSTGVDMVHVPFRGDAPLNTALIAGDIDLSFMPITTGQPLVDSSRVRALGVTGLKRAIALPNVPTLAEAGVAGLETSSWYGIFAPAKTPRPILDRLQREVARTVQLPDIADRIRAQGNEPVGSTIDEFAKLFRNDVARFAKIVEVARIPRQ
jgi:tripartite-type tricarboxylate transporter receptor subunit TctC